jgi:archaellum biogenesis ATPase FlaH
MSYISKSDANKPVKFKLDFGWGTLDVISTHSDDFRAARNQALTVLATSDKTQDRDQMVVDMLSSSVVGWDLKVKAKGGKFKKANHVFNKANVKLLLSEFSEITDALNLFIANKDNYLTKK